MDTQIYQKMTESADVLADLGEAPSVAVILGSGLGAFADTLKDRTVLEYGKIPHFPDVHVVGHSGKLVVGTLPDSTVRVAALAGRVSICTRGIRSPVSFIQSEPLRCGASKGLY